MNIHQYIDAIPSPIAVYRNSHQRYDVFRCHDLWAPEWNHRILSGLLLEARRSYFKYGQRALIDAYDEKAAIYLVRASYKRCGKPTCEWLSIRMVPGEGDPWGVGEPEMYTCDGDSVVNRIASLYRDGRVWNHIISSSRMCGIHPYHIDQNGQPTACVVDQKHMCTAVCFGLIHSQFVLDYPELCSRRDIMVTAIIRRELRDKGLVVHSPDGHEASPLFIPVHETLDVHEERIKLDKNWYAYNFPSYWLNIKQLEELLFMLVYRGKLARTVLAEYKTEKGLDARKLGRLLTIEGKIPDSDMSGQELRGCIDQCVEVKPQLMVTPIRRWNRAVLTMVRYAELDFPEVEI